MSGHTTENDARCWRSECRNGCYYPGVCSERPTIESDAPPSAVETLVMQGPHRIASPDFMFHDGEWWVRTVAVRDALTCPIPPGSGVTR